MDIDKMLHSQEIYNPDDPQILAKQAEALKPMYEYNATLPTETAKRQQLMTKMFAKVGAGTYIEPPLPCQLGWSPRRIRRPRLR